MRSYLGLSIGATNLVAAPAGHPPTIRRAVLTRFDHRLTEVGVPSENPRLDERGLVLTGFVDRVGDPVPIVAGDGSTHSGGQLVIDALEALIHAAAPVRPERTAVAVPAHWPESAVEDLRRRLPGTPVVSDAVAALTALRAQPGLPSRGIVALCDFGATGTTITLADAAAGFRAVGESVRFEEFCGEQIDQAILKHVIADLDVDPSSTSAVVALTRFREECRIAKERLSCETATGLTVPLPGPQCTVRLTRAELETLIRDPLDGLIGALVDTLQRNNVHPADLAALATVGGGARIPLVTQRLSETMRMPVTTSPQAQIVAAVGAGLLAGRDSEEEVVTRIAATPVSAASLAAASVAPAPLAWSADEEPDDLESAFDDARPEILFSHSGFGGAEGFAPLPWYRRPGVLFGAAACLAVVASVGFVLTVRSDDLGTVPAGSAGTSTSVAPPVASQPLQAPAPPAPVEQIPAPLPVVRTQSVYVPVPAQAPPPVRRVAPPPQRVVLAPAPAAPRPAAPAPAPRPPAAPAPAPPAATPAPAAPPPAAPAPAVPPPAAPAPDPGPAAPPPAAPPAADPGTSDPGTADPGTTDPGTTDPGTTDPGTTEPGSADPGTTDPGSADAGTTDPGTREPGAEEPEPAADEPACVPAPGAAC